MALHRASPARPHRPGVPAGLVMAGLALASQRRGQYPGYVRVGATGAGGCGGHPGGCHAKPAQLASTLPAGYGAALPLPGPGRILSDSRDPASLGADVRGAWHSGFPGYGAGHARYTGGPEAVALLPAGWAGSQRRGRAHRRTAETAGALRPVWRCHARWLPLALYHRRAARAAGHLAGAGWHCWAWRWARAALAGLPGRGAAAASCWPGHACGCCCFACGHLRRGWKSA